MPRSFRPRSTQRRGMEWWGGQTSTYVAVADNTIRNDWIILPSTARTYTNPTVVRTRGQMRVSITSQAISRQGAVGIIAWDWPNDLTPLAPSQPDPWANPELDWMWHSFFFAPSTVATTEFFYLKGADSIDSKAMRKLGANQGVLMCLRNASTGADALSFQWGVRCLIKE